jgi:hypothetical protein
MWLDEIADAAVAALASHVASTNAWQQGPRPWQRFGIDTAHASSCN